MNHSTHKPTKSEQRRIESMLKLGCVCCAQMGIWCVAAEIHHIVIGNRRMGHHWTLPLCPGHHRGVWAPEQIEAVPEGLRVSIADGSRIFEAAFGTQRDLWIKVQQRLQLPEVWPGTKIVPRRICETTPVVPSPVGLDLVELGSPRLSEGNATHSAAVRGEEAP